MISDAQNITRIPLGRIESRLFFKIAHLPAFSIEDARRILGPKQGRFLPQVLDRMREKGWIERLKRGRFTAIPLSSGDTRSPQLHEFVIAMELVKPAAIAFFSALNHHGLTEQLPRTVFIATDHPVRRPVKHVLGFSFRVVSVRKEKFFGIQKAWIDERPFFITDREKTVIDAFDLPRNTGGIGIIAAALRSHWKELDESRLRDYAVKLGNSAAVKRLGFLMESLGLGDAEALRASAKLAAGYPRLDPSLPAQGKHNRRWGLLINVKVDE